MYKARTDNYILHIYNAFAKIYSLSVINYEVGEN